MFPPKKLYATIPLLGCACLLLGLSACLSRQPAPAENPLPSAGFTWAYSVSPTPSRTALPAASATARPSQAGIPTPTLPPTPTPFLYTIQKNDTLGVLAFRYGVSVAEIEVLNPGLNAYLLSVGTVITIPASAADATPTLIPTPLPAAVTLDPPQCYLAADGGWWCLALARNPHAFPLENVTAWLSLASADGEILAGQPAIAPLNLLAPGAALPLSAYFPAPLPAQVFPQAQLLTSIPAVITDTRYLPVGVELHLVEIAPGGLSARAEGRVTFPGASAAPSQVWVALTAFDASGRPVGFRRWEAAGEALLTSEVLISASLYSLGPRIASVEAWAEARP